MRAKGDHERVPSVVMWGMGRDGSSRPTVEQAITRHREENARLPYWNTSSTAVIDTAAPSATIRPAQAYKLSACASGSAIGQLGAWHHASQRRYPDQHVDDRTDRQPTENPDGQLLWGSSFLGRGRDRIEPDVGKEHDRAPWWMPVNPFGANGV